MKTIVIAALLALSFTTGFTCSKNTSTETTTTPAPQENMAAPAPVDGSMPATTPAGEVAPGAEMAPTTGTPSEMPAATPAASETH